MLVTVQAAGEEVTVEAMHATVDEKGALIVGFIKWDADVWTAATIDKEITE